MTIEVREHDEGGIRGVKGGERSGIGGKWMRGVKGGKKGVAWGVKEEGKGSGMWRRQG